MSVVKINAIHVPEGMGSKLEERFAQRVGEVEQMEGFEGFELLRPTNGEERYFVYTRWATEDAFQAWVNSEAFVRGHAQVAEHAGQQPVAHGATLLEFEVVQRVVGPVAVTGV